MSYFTLLPIQEGGVVQAGQFYEYRGTFIAPLDSATLSITVGYGQHLWVDYVTLDMLHGGDAREYECTRDVATLPELTCHFPFSMYGHIIPFCSKKTYWSEGYGWCAIALAEDGISCHNGCEFLGDSWEFCNACTEEEEENASVPFNCEIDPRRRYTMRGDLCVFPFSYRGSTYTDCTTDPYDVWIDGVYPPTRAWCALDTEAYLIGECAPCGDFEVSSSVLEGEMLP